jgi:hypothetical protein
MPEPPILLTRPHSASLDEECREVLASVMYALAGQASDPDETSACNYLLKHLTQTAGRGQGRPCPL